jgi:hypothetical protein
LRRIAVVSLSLLASCAPAVPPNAPQVSSSTPPAPRLVGVPQRVQRAPAVIAQYQAAVANRMRDPEGTRFRNTYVVRHPKAEFDALCGEVNSKNAYGGYVGYDAFYAPIVGSAPRFLAIVRTANNEGATFISHQCGEHGAEAHLAGPPFITTGDPSINVAVACTDAADVASCRYALAAHRGTGPQLTPGIPAARLLSRCRGADDVTTCLRTTPVPPAP